MKTVTRAHTRPRPRAIQASRHLHVVPRQHTGHVLPRRHTSYPTLAMILLMVGVLLASWTRWVAAAGPTYGPASGSYTVHVSVPGPPPSEPATIETTNNVPADQHVTVTALPLAVAGNCPVNTYEKLFRNSVFSGVSLCDATGSYQMQTALFPGVNRLQIQDYSLTDVAGPASPEVTVTYNPPAPPVTSGSTGSTNSSSAPATITEPLVLKSSFLFQGYYRGESAPWSLDVEGGQPPYAISADWGDGTRDLISRPAAGDFDLAHSYEKAGGYKGSYPVLFTVSDAAGTKSYLQLMAIINNPPAAAGSTHPTQPNITLLGSTPDWLHHLVRYVWPSYGVLLLMLSSFWLGERREFHLLKPQLRKGHARHS